MKLKFSEYKTDARAILDGKYSLAAGSAFVLFLIIFLLQMPFAIMLANATSYMTIITTIVADFIIELLGMMLFIGLKQIHLSLARGRETTIKDLFYAFHNQSNQLTKIALFFSVINYIFQAPRLVWAALAQSYVSTTMYYLVMLIMYLVWAVIYLAVILNHAVAFELCLDHIEYKVSDALRQSRQIMKGRRMHYFWLHASFIGMYILGLISMMIGFLWVIPYIVQTQECYYLQLVRGMDRQQDGADGLEQIV
ncbi:DUF975 family protein [Eubacterium oxidoreducens]|uniref:Uncharacterized membrane protein n=1 Tax=Eubacterium oxidoreducens TaxID=1732 RepID=A0A1G6CKF0_EUBOX|nr:DUF975 family protein [Eubacterium oxidoreducens]SDB33357.1 Uncharacterized membrane protein [Eubacterium oxidoreducens]